VALIRTLESDEVNVMAGASVNGIPSIVRGTAVNCSVLYGVAVSIVIAWALSDKLHGNCARSTVGGPLKSGELHPAKDSIRRKDGATAIGLMAQAPRSLQP
jgi:hypothetical protein